MHGVPPTLLVHPPLQEGRQTGIVAGVLNDKIDRLVLAGLARAIHVGKVQGSRGIIVVVLEFPFELDDQFVNVPFLAPDRGDAGVSRDRGLRGGNGGSRCGRRCGQGKRGLLEERLLQGLRGPRRHVPFFPGPRLVPRRSVLVVGGLVVRRDGCGCGCGGSIGIVEFLRSNITNQGLGFFRQFIVKVRCLFAVHHLVSLDMFRFGKCRVAINFHGFGIIVVVVVGGGGGA
mmetsp:Transcript_957/g.1963  ORF Transcript_957/g.1963 Transcript_957/m.1963 type:complete len:230 (+) Transcript_957:138-827(+)